MKRWIWMLAAMALALSAAGCSLSVPEAEQGHDQLGAYSKTEEEKTEIIPARDTISMVFYEDMDIHPLTTTNSENHELLKLVYSPLVRLNERAEAVYVLAEKITVADCEVTILLKKGLKFSDGEAVTAADVAAGFRLIQKTPSSPYYARLENLRRWEQPDARTLKLTLREPDVDFISCLDIPVVQKEGGNGCGPYQFSEQDGERVLTPNPHYFEKPSIAVIRLKKPASAQERQNMFSVGLLDVYFDTAESEASFSGGKSYELQTYAGDNLLYIGFNGREGLLKSAKVRSLLSALVDRSKIAETVLLGRANASAYPFHPLWEKASGLQQDKKLTTPEKKAVAEKLGLTLTEKALLDQEGKPLTFSLMVQKESKAHQDVAAAIADELALSGVTVRIEAVARADYEARLQSGEFQLYLGEMKTGRSLNTALYGEASPLNYSGISAPKLWEAAAQYKSGAITLAKFGAIFDQHTPIMPLAYRRGVLFVSADIGAFESNGTWAIYGDITKLNTKETELKK